VVVQFTTLFTGHVLVRNSPIIFRWLFTSGNLHGKFHG
jgi:hypothetical protein